MPTRTTRFTAVACLLGAVSAAPAANPPELGRVTWGRNIDEAKSAAAETDRPVLLLFQEIPGCQGCRDFGGGPLTHPLLVEAIEDEFVPVAIYNNADGYDARVLKQFEEPSWNFPVMRLLDAEGNDLLPRRDRIWSTGDVARRLIEALDAAGRPIPGYLKLVAREETDARLESATFAMHCYWDGEARLGAIDGVVTTEAGWLDGREVVEVVFDPARIEYAALIDRARSDQCAATVYAVGDAQLAQARSRVGDDARPLAGSMQPAKESDRKFALTKSPMRYLPLTPMQAMQVNSAIRRGEDPAVCLSPRQRSLFDRIARVLESDPDRLVALRRPETVSGLPEYEARLRAALGA